MNEIEMFIMNNDDSFFLKTYRGGGWTAKQIIGHLYDTQEVWGERIKQCCINSETVFQSYNPEEYVMKRDYNNACLNVLLKHYKEKRQQMYNLLIKDNWFKEGKHPEEGVLTVKDLVEIIMQHEVHHLEQLRSINNKYTSENNDYIKEKI